MFQLVQGDKVALIAPASGQKEGQGHFVQQAIKVLTGWGLAVVQTPTLDSHRYLATDDIRRADSLKKALTTSEIKAIFVTRGGYGCARLLPLLTGINIPSPRYLVGFSDVTTLNLHFQQSNNVYGIHASNLATELFLSETEFAELNQFALKHFLFDGEKPTMKSTSLCGRSSETIDFDTPMTGGCLSLLITSLGTAHELQTDDKVVMIEEVGESPYKIDRMLTHLKNAGKFEHAKAIVIGDLTGCNSPNIDVLEVVKEVLGDSNCPVLHSPTFGHGALNLPWRYG